MLGVVPSNRLHRWMRLLGDRPFIDSGETCLGIVLLMAVVLNASTIMCIT